MWKLLHSLAVICSVYTLLYPSTKLYTIFQVEMKVEKKGNEISQPTSRFYHHVPFQSPHVTHDMSNIYTTRNHPQRHLSIAPYRLLPSSILETKREKAHRNHIKRFLILGTFRLVESWNQIKLIFFRDSDQRVTLIYL